MITHREIRKKVSRVDASPIVFAGLGKKKKDQSVPAEQTQPSHELAPVTGTGSSGAAGDMLASLFGCPDRIGMAELHASNPTYYSVCYHLKRPEGKFLLVGAAVGLYFLLKR